MTATRYADHYKGDSAGYFDDIEYIAINDNTARMNALMTGQVDAINRIDFKPKACCANPCSIQEVSGIQHYIFLMLTNVAPFGDVTCAAR
jgi:peptide/nickel transport system substrate-binding protein